MSMQQLLQQSSAFGTTPNASIRTALLRLLMKDQQKKRCLSAKAARGPSIQFQ
ncbi:hypothetical protein [Hydrocarboniphaga effusa]|jgi:hypothetical protein|uniref:hypothetical protein n=1 Tax=Hydrocarboniphaga effusa TaxID=243629 RepID=UPI00313799FB